MSREASIAVSAVSGGDIAVSLTRRAQCPYAVASEGIVSVTNRAIAELLPFGHLEEVLACNDASLALEAASPTVGEEVLDIVRANARTLRSALAPWHPSARRLLHGLDTTPITWPALDAPLAPPPPGGDRAIHVSESVLLDEGTCSDIIELFERSPLFEGNVMSAGRVLVDKKAKNRWEFDVSGTVNEDPASPWAPVERLLTGVVVGALHAYEAANPLVRTLKSPFGDEGFRIIRYAPNATAPEHHTWHCDGGQEPLGAHPRVLAAIVYLSQPEEGGETLFLNQGRAVKPKCGRVLIFPSAFPYIHAGKPVTKGRKYAATLMITL